MRRVVRGAETQILNPELLRHGEIVAPPFVVAALFHLVDALRPAVGQHNRRVAVLDSGRKDERLHAGGGYAGWSVRGRRGGAGRLDGVGARWMRGETDG